jgi:plasmid stability protein
MNTALTIEGLDPASLEALKAEALRRGVEMAVVARDILQQALRATTGPEYHDLDHLAGTWSDDETKEFLAATADLRRIDPELWPDALPLDRPT